MPFQKGNTLARDLAHKAVRVTAVEKKNLIQHIKEEGAERFIQELKTLTGEKYCRTFIGVVELAFPKLARHEITGKGGEALFPQPILDVRKTEILAEARDKSEAKALQPPLEPATGEQREIQIAQLTEESTA